MHRLVSLSAVLVVIFIVGFLFFRTTNPEVRVKDFLVKHVSDFEHVILFAEKNKFQGIQFVNQMDAAQLPVKLVSLKGSKEYINITDSSLDELTEFLLSKNIDALWIQHFRGVWLIRKAFTFSYLDRQQEGYFVFGNPEKIGLCVLGNGTKDYGKYEHVAGNWYVAMCEYPLPPV